MPIDSGEKRPYYVLIETNNALEGKTMKSANEMATLLSWGMNRNRDKANYARLSSYWRRNGCISAGRMEITMSRRLG